MFADTIAKLADLTREERLILSKESGIPLRTVNKAIKTIKEMYFPMSLFEEYGYISEDDEPLTLEGLLYDENSFATKEADNQCLRSMLADLLNTLPKRDKEIVMLRSDGYTLQEVGDKLGITRERVRQIAKKRVGELRVKAEALGLREFLK